MSRNKKERPSLPTRTALIVLGMHRSGTSALAGALGHMGCDLPQDIMPPSEANPRGYFESMKTYYLNDALLTSAGSSWDDWKPVNPDWYRSPRRAEYHDRAAAVMEQEFGQSGFFVLKDPRICRLVPFWKDVLTGHGARPMFVYIHRHPQEVALSLARREGWPLSRGLLLWLCHILEAEADSRGEPRVFVAYQALLADWRRTLARVETELKFRWPISAEAAAPAMAGFLSEALRRVRSPDHAMDATPGLAGWADELHAILNRWADTGESKADYPRWDAIRAGLHAAIPTLGLLVQEGSEAALQLADLSRSVSKLQAESATHAANHTAEQKNRGAAEARNAELAQALEQARAEAADHAASHAGAEQARSIAEARNAELTQALEQARAEAANHAASHTAEQKNRGAAEARNAELAQALEQARSIAEARNAELTQALEQARAEAANHAASHAGAEQARSIAEARNAELDSLLVALQLEYTAQEHDMARGQAERGALEQDLHHLQSTLLQRAQETEDMHRQSVHDGERIAILDAELATLRAAHDDLDRRTARATRHLAHMGNKMAAVMQRDLQDRLDGPAKARQAALVQQARLDEEQRQLADLTAERDRLAAALSEQQDSLARTRQEREQALATTRKQQATLKAIASERDRLITGQKALEAEVSQVQGTAHAERDRLAAELEQLRRKSLATLEQVQKAGQARLDEEQRQLADLTAERDRLAAALSEQQDSLARTRQEREQALATTRKQQATLKAIASERDRLITGQKALEAEVSQVQGTAHAERDRLAAELEQLRRKSLATLEQVQKAGQARLDEEQRQLADLTAERDRLTRQQADLRVQVQDLEATRSALMESTSWRVTAPMRRLSSALRRDKT